jgi:hypothetical protein
LSKAKLTKPDYADKSALAQLEDAIYRSKNVSKIIDGDLPIEEQIKKLTDENIFAVKFKQISNDGSDLTEALRENCPPTRTLEEAQKYIDKQMGNGYGVSKLLGVGTIAETYLAKGPDGKEVCLKKINAESNPLTKFHRNLPSSSVPPNLLNQYALTTKLQSVYSSFTPKTLLEIVYLSAQPRSQEVSCLVSLP